MDEFTAVGALADPVRRRVYEYVVTRDAPVGRDEAADALGLAAHTVRFHLERLVEEGLLDTEFRRLSGRSGPGAGRPAKLYCRSPREVAVSLPPRSYDLVGSVLAAAVASSLAGAPLEEALRGEARARGEAAGAAYAGGGGDLARVEGLMEREGFEPVVDDGELTLRNCPFDALAREQAALVCGINLDYVTGVIEGLGCEGLCARLDPGEGRCCVRVGHNDAHEQRRRRTPPGAR